MTQPLDYNNEQIKYFRQEKTNMLPHKSPYLERHVDNVIKLTGIKRTDKILEIGCGAGRYTYPLLRRGYKVSGLDLSPDLLEQLKDNNKEGFELDLHCCDIEEVAKDKQYDVALAFFVYHHIADLKGAFSAATKLLKENGRIIFLEPNPFNILYYLQITFSPGIKWRMEKGFLRLSRKNVSYLLKEAGFENINLQRFGFLPPFLMRGGFSASIENRLENIKPLQPILPFQVFSAVKR